MMRFNLIGLLLLFGLTAEAGKFTVQINPADLKTQQVSKHEGAFTQLTVKGLESDRTVGAPELPVKSWLVQGHPSQIQASLKALQTETLADTKPYPVQEQECRCATDKIRTFSMNAEMYKQPLQTVSVSYLGAYRGTPVSRVDVRFGRYNADRNEVQIVTSGEVSINTPVFTLPRLDFKEYLIVAPTNLVDGVTQFADWKRSQGYTVYVETVASPNNTTAALQTLIKQYYTDKGVDFVIMVGNENTLPMFRVSTAGGSTPSDLKYFTMDGASDYIPDMMASRIAASTPEQVAAQLGKSVEYEQHAFGNASGLQRFIGIASNEGSNPSDDEYVRSIEAKHKEVYNAEVVHFHQNDSANSNPAGLNKSLDAGAAWITYLGHGSGSSWPSMNRSYSVTNIAQLNNKDVVKPIIIDVACQNGRLLDNYLGTTFLKAENTAFGAVAYYGGSVNISWHPPAIMARGIAFEHLSKKFTHLGEALLAGQLYLAANWNKQAEVIDNFEWFHLQGDPGLNISF